MRRLLLAIAVGALLAGCGDDGSADGDSGTDTSLEAPTGDASAAPSTSTKVKLARIGSFDQPVYVAQPPGSSDLYVVERAGRIKRVRDGGGAPDTALEIADQVADEGEQGLLSVAFPPDFQSSRLLYVYLTGNDRNQHVVEYRANEDGTIEE